MSRDDNIMIFNETLNIINSKKYLVKCTKESIKKTIIYTERTKILKEQNIEPAIIKIVNDRTINAIRLFNTKEKTAILNFASATNPGGGVTRGSNAQEESICRITNLYNVLSTPFLYNKFYKINKEKHNTLYSDVVIYSPNIKVIRKDDDKNEILNDIEWFDIDVITCAAPNLRQKKINNKDLLEIHKERGKHILESAIKNNVKNLVLGAFGCGAFKNPPEIVAQAYKEILINDKYAKYFNEIIFAIFCTNDLTNFNKFNEIFNNKEDL